jgi:hypothetical protein
VALVEGRVAGCQPVGPRVDAVVSGLAFVFASRGSYELPLGQDHKQGTSHPCIDDSDSRRIASSRSAEPDTSDPCTRQCASKDASYQHSVA